MVEKVGVQRESWRYSHSYGTAIALDHCMFGLQTDGRCDKLFCRFRTTKDVAPNKPMEIGKLACPREQEYDETEPSECRIS